MIRDPFSRNDTVEILSLKTVMVSSTISRTYLFGGIMMKYILPLFFEYVPCGLWDSSKEDTVLEYM